MIRNAFCLSLLSLLFVLSFLPAADEKQDFFFHKGDRIVFLGDSITEQYQYSSDIELYLTTRFPHGDMTFLNAGIGGDTANGGARRFADHVLAEKPTALTIDFGMNDGGYGGFNADRAKVYLEKTEEMLKAARANNVRVALISPNAVQVRGHEGLKTYLETQQKFYAPLKELAEKYNVPFVDQYAVTRKVLEKIDAEGGKVNPFPDGVHTSFAGGLLMAHTILVGLNAPATVSDLEIDVTAKKTKATDCMIEELQVSTGSVSFQRKDKALPMPVPTDWQALLPYVHQLRDLNYYGLKVTGLDAGAYVLKIDDVKVGEYSAEKLSEGVNLGNLPKGPLFDQGMRVFGTINNKNNLVRNRFRGVIMFNSPNWFSDKLKAEVAEHQPVARREQLEKIQALQAEIYKNVEPAMHRFQLEALK